MYCPKSEVTTDVRGTVCAATPACVRVLEDVEAARKGASGCMTVV
jgi:hypothetical protein